jgi:AmmeMemoRadiSam system protein B
MAHYPVDDACEEVTDALLPSIKDVDPAGLAAREIAVRNARIPGLVCGMCGIQPAVMGLAALRAMGATAGMRIAASTSADADGPRDRTVGYLAVAFNP